MCWTQRWVVLTACCGTHWESHHRHRQELCFLAYLSLSSSWFFDKLSSCQGDCFRWCERIIIGGRGEEVFYFNFCQLLNIFSKHVRMQYAQVLDNAEVVPPFAAKLSVAQQARNRELRSSICLAWLKTNLWSRKFSHWTSLLSQGHNTSTHKH